MFNQIKLSADSSCQIQSKLNRRYCIYSRPLLLRDLAGTFLHFESVTTRFILNLITQHTVKWIKCCKTTEKAKEQTTLPTLKSLLCNRKPGADIFINTQFFLECEMRSWGKKKGENELFWTKK